jgi:TolA-binding protein
MRMKSLQMAMQICLAGMVAGAALGQQTARMSQPQIVNGQVETRAVATNLSNTVQQIEGEGAKPLWIAYGVQEIVGERSVCCGNYNNGENVGCGTCKLETEHGNTTSDRHSGGTMSLERGGQLVVLLRAADKHVMNIRMASNDCTLDAGGVRVLWLTGVKGDESVGLLANYVRPEEIQRHGEHGLSEQALTAIAMHADAAADRAFASFVAATQPQGLREKASFWLGAARGEKGLVLLKQMGKSDPSADVRAQVSFALYVSPEPSAVDEMIRMAHDDESAHVRGQALFWLAQKAGKKAAGAITGAIDNDPDTEVKKKAVFALSQMPKEEGVPKLIQVAQTNKNPEVRKQAMFWLGQSNDPRALEFFEKVLTQ